MSPQVEPPEKKRKKKTKNSSLPPSPPPSSPPSPPSSSPPSPPSSSPSFSLLPDEIAVNCLARISRSYYPRLSIVSKSFRSLLSSTELYTARAHLGSTEQCLYLSLWDLRYQFPQWFTLLINPNRTLHDSMIKKKKKKKKKKTTGQVLVPITSSNVPSVSNSTVAVVGSEIYVIGGLVDGAPSLAVRILDCRSHTWRDAPSMNVAREFAATCFYYGKIYITGGCRGLEDDQPWAEVFDTKTQTWERLPDPGTEVSKCYIPKIKEMEGKIYVGTGVNMYAYDTKQGKWEFCENKIASFLMSECVMENVSYFCCYNSIWCYDKKYGCWKVVKGLDSLREKQSGGVSTSKLVSCGGKLVLTWEVYMMCGKKIWCAEIVVEKRDGGEVWGNVEWVDVVHRGPRSWRLVHCLAVSV